MGTRGLTCVVVDGDFKVAQYGQWDHYLGGQGSDIATFIDSVDLEAFKKAVRECRFIDTDEYNKLWAEVLGKPISENGWVTIEDSAKFSEKYPQLSRDAGGGVLKMILEGKRLLQDSRDFAGESLFCEYAYVVDLDNNTLEVYEGFNQGAAIGRFKDYAAPRDEYAYSPVTLIGTFPIGEAVAGINSLIAADNAKNTEEEAETESAVAPV